MAPLGFTLAFAVLAGGALAPLAPIMDPVSTLAMYGLLIAAFAGPVVGVVAAALDVVASPRRGVDQRLHLAALAAIACFGLAAIVLGFWLGLEDEGLLCAWAAVGFAAIALAERAEHNGRRSVDGCLGVCAAASAVLGFTVGPWALVLPLPLLAWPRPLPTRATLILGCIPGLLTFDRFLDAVWPRRVLVGLLVLVLAGVAVALHQLEGSRAAAPASV